MSTQTEFADKLRVAVASLPRRIAEGVEVREVSGGFEAVITGRCKVLRGFDTSADIAVKAKRNSTKRSN